MFEVVIYLVWFEWVGTYRLVVRVIYAEFTREVKQPGLILVIENKLKEEKRYR